MQLLINELAKKLLDNKTKLVTVESCTGGLVAKLLTDQEGSSAWFESGFVTYSNEAKNRLVNVPEKLLIEHGAVSEPVASAMVSGAVDIFQSCAAISLTGIAGPGGGSNEKPVGLVYIAAKFRDKIKVTKCLFKGGRDDVRQQAAIFSLEQINSLLS